MDSTDCGLLGEGDSSDDTVGVPDRTAALFFVPSFPRPAPRLLLHLASARAATPSPTLAALVTSPLTVDHAAAPAVGELAAATALLPPPVTLSTVDSIVDQAASELGFFGE